jgi:hypothetical protein
MPFGTNPPPTGCSVTVDFRTPALGGPAQTPVDPLGVGVVITEFGGNPVPLVSNTAGWKTTMAALAPGHLRCSIAYYGGNPGYGAGGSSRTPGTATALIQAIQAVGAIPLVSYNGDSTDNGGLTTTNGAALVAYLAALGVKYFSVGNEPEVSGPTPSYSTIVPAMAAAASGVNVGAPGAAFWDTGLLSSTAGVSNLGCLSYHAYDGLDAPGSDNGGGGFYNTSQYFSQTGTMRGFKSGILYGVEEFNANSSASSGATLAFTTSWQETCWIADVLGQILRSGAHGTVYGDSNSALSVISDGSAGLPTFGAPMPAYWGLGIWTGMNGQFRRYSANMVSATTTFANTSISAYACDNGKIVLVNKDTVAHAVTIAMGGLTSGTYNVSAAQGSPPTSIVQVVTGAPYSNSQIAYTVPAQASVSIDVSTSSVTPGSRSQYAWPFTWNSCWNMPISTSAVYAATGITSTFDYSTETIAVENNSVNPSFPVKTFSGGHDGSVLVYCDPGMSGTGAWNFTTAFLRTDGDSVTQGQTLILSPGGNPSLGGNSTYSVPDVSITTSDGSLGAHGGSSLACLGGTLTKADLTGAGPIQHAMKLLYNGLMYYSHTGPGTSGLGWQWPARNADGGYNSPGNVNFYGGSNPLIVEGALLALPPSINPATRYSDPLIQKIATAMQCYGGYICDNTASGSGNATSVIEMNWDAAPFFNGTGTFNSDLLRMHGDLMVVTNSTQATPGGGVLGTNRLAPFAPPFTAVPKLAALSDSFATNDLSTVWANSIGTVTWSSGQVAIKCDTAYDSALESTSNYDLTSSAIFAKVSPYIAGSAATSILLQLSAGNNLFFGYAGGTLAVNININGAQTTLFSTTYNATAHAWWRIREFNGETFFDTSPDSTVWTNQFACPDYVFGFPLTSLSVIFQAGDYGSDPAGTSFVYFVNPTAKTATLADNFASNQLGTIWDNSIGTVTWSPGQVAIKCDTSYDSALQSTNNYDLTSSSVFARVNPYIAGSAATSLLLNSSFGNNVFFGYAGGNLAVNKNVSGAQTTLFNITYSPTAHAWWRIRESGGTTFFDTSPDSVTWTNQYSVADTTFGFSLSSLDVIFQAGDYGSDPVGFSYVYFVNVGVSATVPRGLVMASII